jgi:hypothetical protein
LIRTIVSINCGAARVFARVAMRLSIARDRARGVCPKRSIARPIDFVITRAAFRTSSSWRSCAGVRIDGAVGKFFIAQTPRKTRACCSYARDRA